MRIIESIMTKNPCYTAGKKITVRGLMLHSVGCPQPKASAFINSWNRESYTRACVHGFIDALDGTVYQTLPWNHRGWHGGGASNNTHIGVEMCEPSCITYTGGANFKVADGKLEEARACAKRTYDAAVELFAMLCVKFGLDSLADGVVISHAEGYKRGIASNHGDPEHLWRQLGLSYTMDGFRRDVKKAMGDAVASSDGGSAVSAGLQAKDFKDLANADVIAKVGALFTADMKKSGVLASVSLAQFILESGYGKSELAVNGNNCFGMKKVLSGNTWGGSVWDGVSVYAKKTSEWDGEKYVTVTADFRKYPDVEASIADHSAYLLDAVNGKVKRYEGLKGCTDYKKAVQIIKDGGYAISPDYVEKICRIIEEWGLVKWDSAAGGSSADYVSNTDTVAEYPEKLTDGWYRVRKAWTDSKSQIGAFKVLANAKAKADANAGYYVFDNDGKVVYTGKKTVATTTGTSGNTPTVKRKTVEQLADEVIKGLWGNGAERKKRLTAAGYDYTAVQAVVNRKMK